MELLIVTACRNASPWIGRTLDSVAHQTWRHFRCVVYDDASDDDTADRVITQAKQDSRFRLRRGTTRAGAARARWRVLSDLGDAQDSDLVLILDGDDWLAGPGSLATLTRFCTARGLLASHGTFLHPDRTPSSWSRDYPQNVKRHGTYRMFPWVATHPRVFRYGLFRVLAGMPGAEASACEFLSATDMALFLPLLELAGEATAHCPVPTYIYNDRGGRAYGCHRVRAQRAAEARIRRRPPLRPLCRDERQRLLQQSW